MVRPIVALAAAVALALTFMPTEASARFGGGGFHGGGFHGGGFAFHGGGFRGFHGGFHPGFRRLGPAFAFGAGLGWPYYYAGYPYYDGCVVPRRVWTPYGWRFRYVNACY